MAFMDLQWWESTSRTAKKNIASIHDKGLDAFVVLVGAFSFGGYEKKEDSQRAARDLVSAGISRDHIRIKRIKV